MKESKSKEKLKQPILAAKKGHSHAECKKGQQANNAPFEGGRPLHGVVRVAFGVKLEKLSIDQNGARLLRVGANVVRVLGHRMADMLLRDCAQKGVVFVC